MTRFPRAQPRVRPSSASQSILLIKEILFDYLIVNVAQKLIDLAQIEVTEKSSKMGGVATNEYTWSTARGVLCDHTFVTIVKP